MIVNAENSKKSAVTPTIIAVGNGGYNIAADMIDAGIFSDFKLIICDSDADDLKRNSASADCSFLLDRVSEITYSKYGDLVRPIISESTDVIYLVAALGGMTSRVYAPLIAIAADQPGRFTWHIFTMPADSEGEGVKRRAKDTRSWLLPFGDMKLIQDNNLIPDFPIGEMNRPIVETMAIASLFDIRKSVRYTEDYAEYIPEKYREAVNLYRNPFRYPPTDILRKH